MPDEKIKEILVDRFGLWKIEQPAKDILKISFSCPSERKLRWERIGRRTLKIAYVITIASICFSEGIVNQSIFVFFLLLLPIPLASLMRRSLHGDNRFIPYDLVINGKESVITMTDARAGKGEVRKFQFGDVSRVFFDLRIGKYSPRSSIVFEFYRHAAITLPPHGVDARLLLDPILKMFR